MGTLTTVCLVINTAERRRSVRLPKVLVDTGSEATWVPRTALEEIGIEPEKQTSFRMANGKLIHRDVGHALVRVGNRQTADDVVFAETGDYALLGARTLEGLNLWVDAANKKLVPGRPWPLEDVIVGAERRRPKPASAARRKRGARHKHVAIAHPAPANLPVSVALPLRRKSRKK